MLIEQFKNRNLLIIFVFFSPSCVKNSIRVVENATLHEKIKYIAIGKSTQSAFDLMKSRVVVCQTPTPRGVLEAVKKVIYGPPLTLVEGDIDYMI